MIINVFLKHLLLLFFKKVQHHFNFPFAFLTPHTYSYQNTNIFMVNLVGLLAMLINKLGQGELVNLIEMINLLDENANFVIKALLKVKSYCSTDGKATLNDITNTSTASLI